MSNIFRDKTAGPMVLIGATLALGGLFSFVRGAEIGGAVFAIGFLIEFTGPYLHDRAHRRRGRSRMRCGERVTGTSPAGT